MKCSRQPPTTFRNWTSRVLWWMATLVPITTGSICGALLELSSHPSWFGLRGTIRRWRLDHPWRAAPSRHPLPTCDKCLPGCRENFVGNLHICGLESEHLGARIDGSTQVHTTNQHAHSRSRVNALRSSESWCTEFNGRPPSSADESKMAIQPSVRGGWS